MDNNTLYHHGVLGMKWGVRRYQNKDGTLTSDGRKRYGEKEEALTSKKQKQNAEKIAKLVKGGRTYGEQKEAIKPVVDKMITESIKKRIRKANDDLMDAKPNVDYSKIDNEAYSLLEKNYGKYEKIAKKNKEYEGDETPVWQDVFDVAVNEVLSKYPNLKKQDDRWNKAVDKYFSEISNISNSMLGDFSKMPVDPNNRYSSSVGFYVEGVVSDYADNMRKLSHSDKLVHYGIPGMKWGVRRYQNKDGILTNAGKKRKQISEREQNKSKALIDQAVKKYGVNRQESDKQFAKEQMDLYKKLGVEGYKKKILGYDEDPDIIKDMYNEELQNYETSFKEADAYIKNSRIMEKKLNDIDISSTKYRDVKRLVRQYSNKMINNSIKENYQKEMEN